MLNPITLKMPLGRGFERYRLWVLKKSVFFKTAKFWGMENV